MKRFIERIKSLFIKPKLGEASPSVLRKAKDAVKANPKEQGFTLIEIIIVVVILGLLMAMIVPQIMDSKLKAEKGMKTFAGQQSATVSFVEDNKDTIITEGNIHDCTLAADGTFSCTSQDGSGSEGSGGNGGGTNPEPEQPEPPVVQEKWWFDWMYGYEDKSRGPYSTQASCDEKREVYNGTACYKADAPNYESGGV